MGVKMACGPFPSPSHQSLFLLITLLLHVAVSPQNTVPKNTCSFLDDRNVFKIEVVRGSNDEACPSTAGLNDRIAATEKHLADATFEVMQLQRKVLEEMDKNDELALQLVALQQDLTATQAALPAQNPVSRDCPPGYEVKNDDLKSCYMFVGRNLNWYDAGIFCMSTRGHLAALESENEQRFITDYIKTSNVLPGNHLWTGGNDISDESHWVWAGINKPLNYTNWAANQPDNADDREHCVQLYHLRNYAWVDHYCGDLLYFICEYELLL